MTNCPRVFLPFNLHGGPAQATNLTVVSAWWWMWGFEPTVVYDEMSEGAPLNRHRAMNRAVERFPDEAVYLFAEIDTLIPPEQVRLALDDAAREEGLVIPFRESRALSPEASTTVKDAYFDYSVDDLADWWRLVPTDPRSLFAMCPERTLVDGEDLGSALAVSRKTIDRVGGFPEHVQGPWYDAQIAAKGIEVITRNRTRWVSGPAVHLHHPSTEQDITAVGPDQRVWRDMKQVYFSGSRRQARAIMSTRINPEEGAQ